ncbi:conserved hypothetical protein [Xenorhabdus cabanillasii JM26]|uniref:Uncharacterized protein n=1 Tax=Xenorhabdus cabanillasii JM26 TaxID=1427517 RepID=W1J3A4_9GAMM|nr:conserved hypothetical protein [Xenorhabdus cabanillasii JM26]
MNSQSLFFQLLNGCENYILSIVQVCDFLGNYFNYFLNDYFYYICFLFFIVKHNYD